jgi:hypothetical protein
MHCHRANTLLFGHTHYTVTSLNQNEKLKALHHAYNLVCVKKCQSNIDYHSYNSLSYSLASNRYTAEYGSIFLLLRFQKITGEIESEHRVRCGKVFCKYKIEKYQYKARPTTPPQPWRSCPPSEAHTGVEMNLVRTSPSLVAVEPATMSPVDTSPL